MIKDLIADRIRGLPGDIGIVYSLLGRGERFFAGNCHLFPASGAIKLTALTDCMQAVRDGRLSWDDRVVLRESDKTVETEPTYGALSYLHAGIELTVRDLYNLTLTVSDNVAFNMLVDLLGMDSINKTFHDTGLTNTKLNRKILDMESINAGVENIVSVDDLATFFELLYNKKLVSARASREMLSMLLKHQRTNILPHPFHEKKKIAHFSGYDEDVIVDAGIIYGEHPFVLAMASSGMDVRNAEVVMRDITILCYQETNPDRVG